MADRFSGSVYIGGEITKEQYEEVSRLACEAGCEHQDFELDGGNYFDECVSDDFRDLIDYCTKNNIALSIHWDAKWEYGASVEYWVDGRHRSYLATNGGDIVARVESMLQYPDMTIKDYVALLDIPEFPVLSHEG